MKLDWRAIDRWLVGEAWTGAMIGEHLEELCVRIGERWASSLGERRAVAYIRDQLAVGLDRSELEEYDLDTWSWERAAAEVIEDGTALDLLPFNRCPAFTASGPVVDVGFGTDREVSRQSPNLAGAVAVMYLGFEPFTAPVPHAHRLTSLAEAGAVAAIVIEKKDGRRVEYHSASDWRDANLNEHPLPTVITSREHGSLLRQLVRRGASVRIEVASCFYQAPAHNVHAKLEGSRWPEEHLVLGGHHDTVYGTAGGNDNASGVIAVLETARILAGLRSELGVTPGRSIHFVTYSAEEQKFQGASAFVERHYATATPPRLALNLDELSAGHMKGVVLGFPHLRDLVQAQFDAMGDGLQCHVMAQIDNTSDHFPYLRKAIDAGHLWRWRFQGRHADADFHHEPGDTADKVNVRELKEYGAQLARLLLRLSHVQPESWPDNPQTEEGVAKRLETERGTVIRVY